jgi:type II secretory pathway component PulF
MPLFKYTALAADGKTVSGVMEADNAVRLQQQLKENGQYAKSIVPAGAGSAVLNKSAS